MTFWNQSNLRWLPQLIDFSQHKNDYNNEVLLKLMSSCVMFNRFVIYFTNKWQWRPVSPVTMLPAASRRGHRRRSPGSYCPLVSFYREKVLTSTSPAKCLMVFHIPPFTPIRHFPFYSSTPHTQLLLNSHPYTDREQWRARIPNPQTESQPLSFTGHLSDIIKFNTDCKMEVHKCRTLMGCDC